ncbi:MAG: hypothetical protein M3Q58_11090, partial [Bacteroidota bacterium]|nr:hypothetical protein [Bacteroidota bacterium]
INTADLDSFVERVIDIKFYTNEPVAKQEIVIDEPNPVVEPEPLINTDLSYEHVLEKYGDVAMKGLIYKVQIGAYNMPYNFKYSHLAEFGKVENLVLEDNITRFTIGTFNTLKEAEVLKKKIIAKGGLTTDSFITAILNGKRVFLEDLIKSGFKL